MPLDVGQCFNPISGAFTAPQNGVYLFGVDSITFETQHADIYLRVNGKAYKRWEHWQTDINAREVNGMVVLPLREGDEITLSNGNDGNIRGFGTSPFLFMGVLMY